MFLPSFALPSSFSSLLGVGAIMDSHIPEYGNPPTTTPWPFTDMDTDADVEAGAASQPGEPTQPIDIPQPSQLPKTPQNAITDTAWGKQPSRAMATLTTVRAARAAQPIDDAEASQSALDNTEDDTWIKPKRRATGALKPKRIVKRASHSLTSGPDYARYNWKNKQNTALDFTGPWISEDSARMRRQHEFDQLHSPGKLLSQGDTLVFIDFPPLVQGKRVMFDCDGVPFVSQQVRVHSEKLLATDSSKFRDMLNPTYQFRILRRRKLVNRLPEGVKYLLDLTPPSEGDELVFQMTELSLTPGIANWWKSYRLHDVPYWLVKGHDDVCNCESNSQAGKGSSYSGQLEAGSTIDGLTGSVTLPPTVELLKQLKARRSRLDVNGPPHFDIPDYCPVRHCNSILRLLMHIEGHQCTFDSAPRVWTTLGVAKILDCPRILIDSVTTWLHQESNIKFIEVLPEEALQIGFALQAPAVAESAFRILVNELALEQAADPTSNLLNKNATIFGRTKGDAGDELNNLIQHAARAIVDRMSMVLRTLRDPNLIDTWELPEWQRLLTTEQQLENAQQTFLTHKALSCTRSLIGAIRKVIPGDVDRILREKLEPQHPIFQSSDKDRATYASPENFVTCYDIITQLNETQSMLLPFIYCDLGFNWERGPFTFGRSNEYETKNKRISELAEEFNHSFRDYKGELSMRNTGQIDRDLHGLVMTDSFALSKLETEALPRLQVITESWLRHDIPLVLNMTLHLLLTLVPNEMKYLPLWAGGCDDGTGGVFEDFLPPAEMGPNGPGPSYHTGLTVPSDSSVSGSLINGLDDLSVRGSTTAASVDVHDSISTVYRPDEIIADDNSIAPSESFSMIDGLDYNEARLAVDDSDESKQLFEDIMMDPPSDDDSTSTITEQEFISDIDEMDQEPAESESDAASTTARSEDSFVVV